MNSKYHVGFSLFEKEDFFNDDTHERTSTYVEVLIFVEGFWITADGKSENVLSSFVDFVQSPMRGAHQSWELWRCRM